MKWFDDENLAHTEDPDKKPDELPSVLRVLAVKIYNPVLGSNAGSFKRGTASPTREKKTALSTESSGKLEIAVTETTVDQKESWHREDNDNSEEDQHEYEGNQHLYYFRHGHFSLSTARKYDFPVSFISPRFLQPSSHVASVEGLRFPRVQ
ncbi:MAG: hypothetical protein JXM70_23185 [Pirellulales bacterium]|nr:hypothetical protein [Pirellulales bacterium]